MGSSRVPIVCDIKPDFFQQKIEKHQQNLIFDGGNPGPTGSLEGFIRLIELFRNKWPPHIRNLEPFGPSKIWIDLLEIYKLPHVAIWYPIHLHGLKCRWWIPNDLGLAPASCLEVFHQVTHSSGKARRVYPRHGAVGCSGYMCMGICLSHIFIFASYPTTTTRLPAIYAYYICSKIVWTNPRPNESLMSVFNTVVSLQIEWSVSWNHSLCGHVNKYTSIHVYMLCSPVAVATSEFTGIDSTAVEVTNIMFQTISNRKRTRTGKPITVQPCSTIIDRWLGVTEMRRPFVA